MITTEIKIKMHNTIGNIHIKNITTNVGHSVASGKKNSSLQTVWHN